MTRDHHPAGRNVVVVPRRPPDAWSILYFSHRHYLVEWRALGNGSHAWTVTPWSVTFERPRRRASAWTGGGCAVVRFAGWLHVDGAPIPTSEVTP